MSTSEGSARSAGEKAEGRETAHRLLRVGIALGALALIALASCTIDADHCLRMSDCYEGTTCIEGLCEADPITVPDEGGTTEGGAAPAEASVVVDSSAADASSDASADANADAGDGGDADADGSVTDASTD